ncbi:MAG: molecular chaperone HtpG [Candidatus Kapaibacteriota bacterium]
MSENATKTNSFEFKAEMKQLLNLIIHSLYTNPDVFLRELVSNSSDALNKVKFMQLTGESIVNPELELKIDISIDKENKTLTIQDTGIGMSQDDLINHLGTIAKSGTLEFFKNMQENKNQLDGNLIGQFGVGFYSVYMITDEVVVETQKAVVGEKAYKWTSRAEENFEIEEIENALRGTKITFVVKDEYSEFLEDWKIKEILKRYSNFVDFPIYLNGERANTVTAIWQRKKDEVSQEELTEFYKFISSDYNEPLDSLHLNIEGNVNFKSLLFFPKEAPVNFFSNETKKTLQLYVNKVFIQDDAEDLLPDYLKFMKGVVDTTDLPLNVSREVTQKSPIMAKIKDVITNKILGTFENWANEDKEKYDNFFGKFASILKAGLNSDYKYKDRLVKLMRYESSALAAKELTSLTDYVSRMKEGQEEIYYFSGQSRESVEKNPNLEYFRKNDIEVIILTDPMDVFTIPSIFDFEGKKLKSIDKDDVNLDNIKSENTEEDTSEIDEIANSEFIQAIKDVLGDKIEDVKISKRLVDSPVTLVVGKEGMDAQMEKMMQMMDKDYRVSKRILEINPKHKIITNLKNIYKNDGANTQFSNIVVQLFESGLLLEGYLKSPVDFVNRMYSILEQN